MALTPQLIKDQEFQVKFRGCDPLEVRDYLESIADEFFELQEQCKEQLEELEELRQAKDSSAEYNSSLETDMQFTRKISEELKDGCSQKEERIKELNKEVEELQLRIADMDQENAERDEEVSEATARIEEAEDAVKVVQTEKEILHNKIEILKEQNQDLKKEEVDFKSTLATAQSFAEDLKEKSRQEAEQMIADANAAITKIREDAHAELERLPREIDSLKQKKSEVKSDLKATLASYLETIEVFYPDEDDVGDQEAQEAEETQAEVAENAPVPDDLPQEESTDDSQGTEDLFQTIAISDDGSLAADDVERLNAHPTSAGAPVMDGDILDSLLRDTSDEQSGDEDSLSLKDMFSLETRDEDKKNAA
jgi:DivIVA domain-containing protein